jgi:hypothetical protein
MKILMTITAALTFVLLGCATTTQTMDVTESGFLRDYSKLQPGKKGEAQLRYVNPNADFAKYDKILMDPIAVYAAKENSDLSKLPQAELQDIVNYLDATVRDQLSADYKFVDKPGPGTMRLRIAITEVKGANVALSAGSTVLPIARAVSAVSKLTTGTYTGVARSSVEMELLDSETGERLFAGVDERAGGRLTGFKKWEGIQKIYDYWAKSLRERLAELRAAG